MGNNVSKAPVVASTDCPIYAVSSLAGHHLLAAGGGGSSKSGVPNKIQIFSVNLIPAESDESFTISCTPTVSFDTDTKATMNMDLALLDRGSGQALLAAGQDDQCHIYKISPVLVEHNNSSSSELSFELKEMNVFKTDFNPKGADACYQKVVKLHKQPETGVWNVFTGGSDGKVRVWSPNQRNSNRMEKIEQIEAHNDDVSDIDISEDGSLLLTVGADYKCFLWSASPTMGISKKADVVFTASDSDEKFKIRAARFTRLGSRTCVFLTVASPIQVRSKGQRSYLTLWLYNPSTGNMRTCLSKIACQDTISSVTLNSDTSLCGVGTMAGAVGIYETDDLQLLKWIPDTHGIFVTSVAFLSGMENGPGSASFGLSGDYRASVISVAADKTVQVHHLPWHRSKSTSIFLMQLSAFLFLFVVLLRIMGL